MISNNGWTLFSIVHPDMDENIFLVMKEEFKIRP